jgi:hypothetical protein
LRRVSACGVWLLILSALFPAPARAVKRDIIKELSSDYAGRSYQIRVDLRGTDYFAAFNVVDDKGVHYQGREQAIMFYQMETVYLDRISSEGDKQIRIAIYRSREDARQIRGSVPAAPIPVGPDRASTLSNFARDLSTNVILQLQAGKAEPSLQRTEIAALLEKLFFLKETPTFDQKEAFILSHPDLPMARLTAITGLSEDLVRGIQMKGEARKQQP